MNKDRLSLLFEKALSNNISDQEREELFLLLGEEENNREIEQLFDKARFSYTNKRTFFTEHETENLEKSILKKSQINAREHKFRYQWQWPAAAIIALFVGIGIFFYLNTAEIHSLPQQKTVLNKIMPVKNRATLVLGNGKVVNLEDIKKGEINEEGVIIKKTDDGKLIYENASNGKRDQRNQNILSTPRGGQYQLILPDGSKVWLSAASSLHYPTDFEVEKRVVTLKGEAYFEIAKNQASPFIIHANGAKIHVLGTSFLVSAYDNTKKNTTTLVEGKVRIDVMLPDNESNKNSMILKPGEQATLDVETKKISMRQIDINDILAWKRGALVFQGDNIRTVMKTIERWYDVDVVYTGDVSGETFIGTVSKFDSLEKLLNTIELTGGVHFKIEGRKVFVMK
jgi:transmembrane sensor